MPSLNFPVTLDINLERFLSACSDVELQELSLLLDREFRIRENRKVYQAHKQEVILKRLQKKQKCFSPSQILFAFENLLLR